MSISRLKFNSEGKSIKLPFLPRIFEVNSRLVLIGPDGREEINYQTETEWGFGHAPSPPPTRGISWTTTRQIGFPLQVTCQGRIENPKMLRHRITDGISGDVISRQGDILVIQPGKGTEETKTRINQPGAQLVVRSSKEPSVRVDVRVDERGIGSQLRIY